MLTVISRDDNEYLSVDNLLFVSGDFDGLNDITTLNFFNTINIFYLPNHILRLKVGVPLILLRNKSIN
uniref:DNA helicase Pif1-like 2B domain-containing protein n=1 Tax=Cajanus cajan TaxID=3821 RepID=A0A151SAN8_CAJCA|nr:hypothetical protein KK1_026251 [Cajanus cajan]